MKLPNNLKVNAAFEAAVVALLNSCPEAEEHEAEEFVEAMAKLIFTTMQTYIEEEHHVTADHH